MPFSLTGAPLTFANMTADNMYDLLADEVTELFDDDGGAASVAAAGLAASRLTQLQLELA
jgi:hypothetical protein